MLQNTTTGVSSFAPFCKAYGYDQLSPKSHNTLGFFFKTDAPFEVDYVLEVLGPQSESSALYGMLNISLEMNFEQYIKQHPNPWKNMAEVLYRCGEGTRLNKLFVFVKSSEGNMK